MSIFSDALNWFAQRTSKLGRRRKEPERETDVYPRLMRMGRAGISKKRPLLKPTPRNLRFFSHTPHARRAINAIKNPIARLPWKIVPKPGIKANSVLDKQAAVVTRCLQRPNNDDSFRTMIEAVVEDILCGAGAIEQQLAGDPERPLWMWPVDGLSIQIYPLWDGSPFDTRYVQAIGYGPVGGLDKGIPLTNDELVYIKPNPVTWSPFGQGPLETAFITISRMLGVASYAGDLASNAQPSAIIYLGEEVSADEQQAFRNWWVNEVEGRGTMPAFGGPKAPEILQVRGGTDDSLYLKYQEVLARELANAFDLSPQNFGIERDVNRNTSEVAEDRDWDHAIIPNAHSIEDHLTRDTIEGRLGFTQLMFKFEGLDREDELANAEIYQIRYQNNAVTPNEHREKLGMEPMKSDIGDMTYLEAQAKYGKPAAQDPKKQKPTKPNKEN